MRFYYCPTIVTKNLHTIPITQLKRCVPRGTPPIGYDLENNGNASKGRRIFHRYHIGGGDMEVFHFHHEKYPPLHHHATRYPIWVKEIKGDRDSQIRRKVGAAARG